MHRVAGLFPDGGRRLRNEVSPSKVTFMQLCCGVLCAGESADGTFCSSLGRVR